MGGGWFQVLVWIQVSNALGDFAAFQLIRGCTLGPLEASALGGKTSSLYGKVSKASNATKKKKLRKSRK